MQLYLDILLLAVLLLGHVQQLFCDPMDCSSSVHGISQARILEWIAISFSRASPDPGSEPTSPAWQVGMLPLNHQGSYLAISTCHIHILPPSLYLRKRVKVVTVSVHILSRAQHPVSEYFSKHDFYSLS